MIAAGIKSEAKRLPAAAPAPRRRLSAGGTFLVGLLVTAVALPESWQGWPYAPFPVVHALLALIVPVWAVGLRWPPPFGELWAQRRLVWRTALMALAFMAGYVAIYGGVLHAFGKSGDPTWDLVAQYRMLGTLYVERYGWTATLIGGYVFIGIWPMFGEELFYRRFLIDGLRPQVAPVGIVILSSALFGLRHAFQLVYLWPQYPVGAGIAYFVWAAGFGVLWAAVYLRSGSLWPCMATHAANLLLAPLVFAWLGGGI